MAESNYEVKELFGKLITRIHRSYSQEPKRNCPQSISTVINSLMHILIHMEKPVKPPSAWHDVNNSGWRGGLGLFAGCGASRRNFNSREFAAKRRKNRKKS